MCGIAGILGHVPGRLDQMERMLKAQGHRGPDALEFLNLGAVALGHNRLSVIDLDEAANQPFCSEEGRYTLIFNGEIYNYLELKALLQPHFRFRTLSDTEVLLAAYIQWGPACLDRLIGMFAFAIWDGQAQRLFAARDRFGVKPFYHATLNGAFLFASEIKTLWAAGVPKRAQEAVWAGYFAHGTYGQPSETFWEGIAQLPAGHCLTWENGRVEQRLWYHFTKNIQAADEFISETDTREKWIALARESIRLRFRADVPVGFNLSGGLDSSLLLGLVQDQFGDNPGIQSFTFYTGDPRYDELQWAREMVAHTQFPHSAVPLSQAEIPALAAAISACEDEPFGGIPTLAYSKIFEQARANGMVVLLDGQGLDEVWAGYDYYAQGNGSLVQGTQASAVNTGCLQADFMALAAKPVYPTPFENALQNLQYRDIFHTKLPRALRFNDRVSMLHGTELREPFLDHRLVEMAFALPQSMKIRDGQQKWLLRQIAAEFLPIGLHLAPKRALQTPQREWLAQDLRPWVSERVEALAGTHPHWFQSDKLRKAYQTFTTAPLDNSFFVWQWVNTSLLLS